MSRIAASIAFAFVNLLHPRMLWLMVWPVLVATGCWLVVALVLWMRAALWIAAHLKQWIESGTFLMSFDTGDAMLIVAHVLLFLLIIPAIVLTALFILSAFGMPSMIEHVAALRFGQLERRRGGSVAGSVWNAVVAILGLAGLCVVTLPLWLLPPLWPMIAVAILAWVNQRVLRYDALAEHASAEEMTAVFRAHRGTLYLMGLALALIAYIPVVGLFAPVLFGLAMIHFLLRELQALRQAPIEGQAVRL